MGPAKGGKLMWRAMGICVSLPAPLTYLPPICSAPITERQAETKKKKSNKPTNTTTKRTAPTGFYSRRWSSGSGEGCEGDLPGEERWCKVVWFSPTWRQPPSVWSPHGGAPAPRRGAGVARDRPARSGAKQPGPTRSPPLRGGLSVSILTGKKPTILSPLKVSGSVTCYISLEGGSDSVLVWETVAGM